MEKRGFVMNFLQGRVETSLPHLLPPTPSPTRTQIPPPPPPVSTYGLSTVIVPGTCVLLQ